MGAEGTTDVASREARVAAMLRVLPEAVFELDRQGRFLEVHGGEIDLVAPREQTLGRRYEEVLAAFPHLVTLLSELLSRAFDGHDASGDYALELPDGQHFYEARATLAGDRVVIAVREITEARRLLGQLVVADRQRTVSALSAALIHELGNPLAYMLTALDALRRKVDADPVTSELAEIAVDGARRLSQITGDFRALARADDSTSSARLDLTVQRALRFAAASLGPEQIVVDVPEGLLVAVPEGRLGQVLLNLFANAAHALEHRRAARVEVTAQKEDPNVRLFVRDQGVGIAPEHLVSIFEPFFTTKPDGRGTGLGLWIVRRIVEEHGGSIHCTSTLGEGTTFELVLPIT